MDNQPLSAHTVTTTHRQRLFVGCCLALISTSVAFGVLTSLIEDFKTVFALTNTEAGWVRGAAIWGFTLSIFVIGPLCDAIGMGRLLRLSFLGHIVGPIIMIFAKSFWPLFTGSLVIALSNGIVEAVCNPLVATLFPRDKTHKLNQFHVWFPGGIVIGGLLAFCIDKLTEANPDIWQSLHLASWQVKLSLVLIPTITYGIIFTRQRFPATERVQSGLSFGDMFRETVFRPFFLLLFFCMGITASLELGPNSWMGEVMKTEMSRFFGGGAGILVLVYGSGLMAVLRFYAGPVVHRFSPTGVLMLSAILGGVGLTALTFAKGAAPIIISATIFYVGVCYFWPTMLGVAAERVPKGGALALSLLGGWGMAIVGLITVPVMGWITDYYGHQRLPDDQTRLCIRQGLDVLREKQVERPGIGNGQLDAAIQQIQETSDAIQNTGTLPLVDTSKTLRDIARFAPDSEPGAIATQLLQPADDYGGIMSFRWVAATSIVIVVIFGFVFLRDRAQGGYQAVELTRPGESSP